MAQSDPNATIKPAVLTGEVITLPDGRQMKVRRRTPMGFALRTDEIEIAVHDRLYAPNTRASFERGAGVLAPILAALYDDDVEIAPTGASGQPFTVLVRAPRRELAWLKRRAG